MENLVYLFSCFLSCVIVAGLMSFVDLCMRDWYCGVDAIPPTLIL